MEALRIQLLLVAAVIFLAISLPGSDRNAAASEGSLKVVAPGGGEIWSAGTRHEIRWEYTGYCGSHVTMELLKGDTFDRTIVYRSYIGDFGKIGWTIPHDQLQGDYTIKIASLGLKEGACVGISNSFTITAPPSNTVDKTSGQLVKEAKAEIKEVSVDDVKKMVDAKEKIIVLDVRDREEFETGSIPSAINVSRGMLEFKVNMAIPDKNVKVVVYCSVDLRGPLATKTLNDLGYKNAVNIIGGLNAWKEAGYPIER
jgi:rhodanese-related sulfurtransferase